MASPYRHGCGGNDKMEDSMADKMNNDEITMKKMKELQRRVVVEKRNIRVAKTRYDRAVANLERFLRSGR